ncbi:MAG: response regulator [Candidatus Omnitrophota bacterium]
MSKKILIVDDEADIFTVEQIRLESLGYNIVGAKDAESALDYLKKDHPDLILLDLLLPKMQGDVLCKKLKADENYKSIPIILFTASTIRTDIPEVVKEMGADDCVLKPFDPKELIGKIKKYIG